MSLLDLLTDQETWLAFRDHKLQHALLSQKELDYLEQYIAAQRYLPLASTLAFPLPEKKQINKSGSRKKRTVYLFEEDTALVLKLLAYLLYHYDSAFADSCYSFRQGYTARTAFSDIQRIPSLSSKYVLKADIHDYFNSIPPDLLAAEFPKIITDDAPLVSFLTEFFTLNKCIYEGAVIEECRGAMAGVPLSAFCANIYLSDLDRKFEAMQVPYFRYSDDILILADSASALQEYLSILQEHIEKKGLQLNPEKVSVAAPGEAWDFLGFKYRDGRLDLSDATMKKMKDKIRRKAHALYRWRLRKGADYDRTARAMIRRFNRKFYDIDGDNEFTWSRWFFPVLTSTDGLAALDRYLLEYLRYLYSGRHYKGNFAITYAHLKELGFRSLVHEYYSYRKS